jgi:hypothetical protein
MLVHARGSRCAREETSSDAEPARGGHEPSSEVDPARGGVSPRARRTLLEGVPCWATLVGRGGHRGGLCCVCMFCVRFEVCLRFAFFQVLSMIPPGFFRPLWLSPTFGTSEQD